MRSRAVAVTIGAAITLIAARPTPSRADGEPPDRPDDPVAVESSWWVRPLDRVLVRIAAIRERARPLSTVRRRDVAGAIALWCERREGRPCGGGAGGFVEFDSTAGFAQLVVAGTRLRATAGTDAYAPALAVDRAFVRAHVGPIAASAGRDVIILGRSARTQLAWGDHAPPIDHVQLSTWRPLVLAPSVRADVAWTVGRLAPPQVFRDNLVSALRGRLEVGSLEVGATQLLQLGGVGAPELDAWGFLREHVTRGDASASASDTSNRRVGFDVAAPIAGARVYYAVMFEDWRARLHDALRYDADHLLGAELHVADRHALVVELTSTGVRSHEHVPRTTGFTHRGVVVGSPLGPDAVAVYAGLSLAVGRHLVAPWIELAQMSSDDYAFVVDGPILHTARGPDEERYRLGVRYAAPISRDLQLACEAMIERVHDVAFVPGSRRTHAGFAATFVWNPPWTIAMLDGR